MKKDINYYLSLPYRIEVQQNSDGSYFGRVVELEGCMTEADSVPELIEMLEDAKKGWLEIALEDGLSIPEPDDKKYSGQFNLRLPTSLHKSLVMAAQKENVSLNQYILYLLSKRSGISYRKKTLAG